MPKVEFDNNIIIIIKKRFQEKNKSGCIWNELTATKNAIYTRVSMRLMMELNLSLNWVERCL